LAVVVGAAVGIARLGAQFVERLGDLRPRVAVFDQVGCEQLLLDVAVALAVGPVSEEAVAELVAEKGDDSVLSGSLRLADGTHTNRILPVSNSCIMPCLSARALMSFASCASISA